MKKERKKITSMGVTGRTFRKTRSELAKPYRGQVRRRKASCLKRVMEKSDRLYICEWCRCECMSMENHEWMWHGKPLKLQIDHIKGLDECKNEDADKAENLRWLCANCHTQTPNSNYAVKSLQQKHPKCPRPYQKALIDSDREYVCANCKCQDMYLDSGFWHWRDWPLKLEINHIAGRDIPDPDSLQNLEWLCPNCHFQHSMQTRVEQLKKMWKRRNVKKEERKIQTGLSCTAKDEVIPIDSSNVSIEHKTDKARGKEPADL